MSKLQLIKNTHFLIKHKQPDSVDPSVKYGPLRHLLKQFLCNCYVITCIKLWYPSMIFYYILIIYSLIYLEGGMLRSEDNFQVSFVSSGVRCRGSKLRFSGLMKKKYKTAFIHWATWRPCYEQILLLSFLSGTLFLCRFCFYRYVPFFNINILGELSS